MFSRPTVFILGAGASWHYGYPTGEQLVGDVLNKAHEFHQIISRFKNDISREFGVTVNRVIPKTPSYILEKAGVNYDESEFETEEQKAQIGHENYNAAIEATLNECLSIQTKLKQVDPPVIDHFLNRNTQLKDIGRLLISWSILEKEILEQRYKVRGQHWRGNWYRYIVQHLMSGCDTPEDLLDNKVKFVTFNYDVSLERNLSEGLKQNHFFDGTNVVEDFFDENRVIHVYGKIKENPLSPALELKKENKRSNVLTLNKEILDPCHFASKGIRTIAPSEKIEDKQILDLAKTYIQDAECVYILGYGFDKENSENIGLTKHLKHKNITRYFGSEPKENYKGKEIYFTNYENKNIVSKRASQVFYSDPSAFLPPNGLISADKRKSVHFEMSTKDVYQALSDDFEIFD